MSEDGPNPNKCLGKSLGKIGASATITIVAAGFALFVGCDSAGEATPPPTPPTSTASGGSGQGGTTGQGGGGGAGGSNVGGGPASGLAASETVSAGQVVSDSQYKMIFTLGQPTLHQGKAESTDYEYRGGVAATQGD